MTDEERDRRQFLNAQRRGAGVLDSDSAAACLEGADGGVRRES